VESMIDEAIGRDRKYRTLIDRETHEQLQAILQEIKTNIVVLGIGSVGCIVIQRMSEEGITGVELYAAIESKNSIEKVIGNADLVFIVGHLGEEPEIEAIPVVAEIARNAGALTIAVVSLPFYFEGETSIDNVKIGLKRLQEMADTVIVVPNDKLLEECPKLPLRASLKCDELMVRVVKGIFEPITKPGLVSIFFADIREIMQKGGLAMIEVEEAEGENKAIESIQKLLRSPLLDKDISDEIKVLVNLVVGRDVKVVEVGRVVDEIFNRFDRKTTLFWGATVEPELENIIRIMFIVTGIKFSYILAAMQRQESHLRGQINCSNG
jgi:cell division protein FtsZ